jgi:hypothetical protein
VARSTDIQTRSPGNGRYGYGRPPLPKKGEQRAATHRAFISRFTPAEQAEIAELEDQIRELVPISSPTVEPAVSIMATQVWRYHRLTDYVAKNGLHVGRPDRERLRPAVLHSLELEKAILNSMRQLGMTPRSAGELGLTLAKLERFKSYDFSRLSADEREQFDKLAEKAATYRDAE